MKALNQVKCVDLARDTSGQGVPQIVHQNWTLNYEGAMHEGSINAFLSS